MEVEISLSTPMVMGGTWVPTWALNVADNRTYLKKLKAKYPKKFITYMGVKPEQIIYHAVVNKTHEIFFVQSNDLIQYAVVVDTIHTTGKISISTVSQISVWRNRDYPYTVSLPKWFFANVLYPRYDTILSDKEQTHDGKDFWTKRVMEVMDQLFYKGEQHIYALKIKDRSADYFVEEVHRIETLADLEKYYTQEPNEGGKKYRLLITKKPML